MSGSRDLIPRERNALTAAILGAPLDEAGVVDTGPRKYLVHFVEFKDADSCSKFNVPEITVFDRFERFADVFIPVDNKVDDRLKALRAAPGYVWDEFGAESIAPPPITGNKGTSRAVPEAIVRGGFGELTGKGVIVVIIDTGLDFRNADFVTYDQSGEATSRLRYFWDTSGEEYAEGRLGQPSPVSYPNGAPIGTLYSRDDLNRELRSNRTLIPVWDIDGHGTSCAGIAAGNGNNSEGKYKGVAPEAELIGVRLGDDLENAFLLNTICGWVHQLAGNTPVVFSCSFGSRAGGHDGMTIEERQLDARFPDSIVGRALCIAAGNDGTQALHAKVDCGGSNAPGVLSWSTPSPAYMEVYYGTSDDKDLRYADKLGLKETGAVNPLLDTYVSFFEVPAGPGEMQLYSQSGKKFTAHAYFTSFVDGCAFQGACAADGGIVASPGVTCQAITVGSYDWNDQFDRHGHITAFTDPLKGEPLTIGALSKYSSVGPLRTRKVTKPDIASPGQYYAAPAARNTRALRDTSGQYDLFNGTSAATPYTAGIVALLMQKKPSITLGELKSLLQTCATQDRFTGPVPNDSWGNGKLDRAAVEKMISKL
ncbi:MAG TPA: S8 family serine peptidase [Pirellulales bacterium]|nr:S8 family serine peptidase [Pirellulales bacterium]